MAAPRNYQVDISSLIFPAGNVMFRSKSICDGHDASYLFDQGAVSSKHIWHFFILRMLYMQYRSYRWTYINTDGVTGVDARTDRQTDRQAGGRTDRQTQRKLWILLGLEYFTIDFIFISIIFLIIFWWPFRERAQMTLHGSREVRIPYLSLRSPIFDRGTDSIGSKFDRQSIANSF